MSTNLKKTCVNRINDLDKILILILAKYIASLARIRTGISDGFLSCEVLERLIDKIYAPPLSPTNEDAGDEDEMLSACAIAIGALSYNKTAFRLLYNLVRRDPRNYPFFVKTILSNKSLILSTLRQNYFMWPSFMFISGIC